jgi:hypothetical protein
MVDEIRVDQRSRGNALESERYQNPSNELFEAVA